MIASRTVAGFAAAPPADALAAETLPWLGLFAAIAILAWIGALWLRRMLRRERSGPVGGFEAKDLDRLRETGELSEAQVRAIMRAAALQASRRASGPETGESAPERGDHGLERDR